jgi:hypothetical protein
MINFELGLPFIYYQANYFLSSKAQKTKSWRNNFNNFIQMDKQTLSPGVETFSVGWLPQGHAVSTLTN